MRLFYDVRDEEIADRRGDRRLYWLGDLGAAPLTEAGPDDEGFIFAGARPTEDDRRLVARLPRLRDHPEEREPLLRLDSVLAALAVSAMLADELRRYELLIQKLTGYVRHVASPDVVLAARLVRGIDEVAADRAWTRAAPPRNSGNVPDRVFMRRFDLDERRTYPSTPP